MTLSRRKWAVSRSSGRINGWAADCPCHDIQRQWFTTRGLFYLWTRCAQDRKEIPFLGVGVSLWQTASSRVVRAWGLRNLEQSWRLHRAGCIMLAQVSVSTLDAYRDLMFHYSRRYDQVVWAIQYQADVRARLEQLERLSRKGAAEASLIPNHAFCSTKPWEWCFQQSVDESAGFWRRLSCLVKSGATTLASVVEGDAPVKGDNLSAFGRILRGGPLPKARPKRQRHQDNAGGDGLLATNRTGYSLCPGWQDGTCTDSRTKGWCRGVPGMAHQCAKCLSQEHGAHACQRPVAQTPRGVGSWAGYDRSKAKGKSGSSPDYLCQRRARSARFPTSSESTTLASSIWPALLPRRSRVA